ncbi:hypothetical protein BCR32DRAFT_287013 [Anaeromyces robustus]|uniref:Uncharacterized protein n=1 Tax=Anaeromyces robustus TaxID=1754192 RepID=A0A1Y1VUZ1_9FUNG|nr:hypothetical protein BCR32DRAFT_287013 [Anaeromyces robustus]|eukprot:ORX64584.1 hypothetical protein BCR32DRAFT_287013 [Anaeromyces robustus]
MRMELYWKMELCVKSGYCCSIMNKIMIIGKMELYWKMELCVKSGYCCSIMVKPIGFLSTFL